MQEAKQVLESLARMERLQQAILNMDQATMSEIKSYNKPPDGVHDIMRATFLMLGEHEGKTQVHTNKNTVVMEDRIAYYYSKIKMSMPKII